jgi:hypothetical protein
LSNFYSQCLAKNLDDYALCLKHEVGDFDLIPENLKKEIDDFAQIKFWPAVFEYLGKILPKFRYFSVADLEEHGLELPFYIEDITRELNYDLVNAEIFLEMPASCFRKIDGKRLVGFVIRICKAIDKQELADQINQIVEKHFTPVDPDPKDSFRASFRLCVEPSTGGIQCVCCKGEDKLKKVKP